MKPLLPALLLGFGLSTATTTSAAAYPVDCAILLCLAGGFPASEHCTRARAEMIRRITPWPIEPPLQLWRCPMRAATKREDRLAQSGPIEIRYLPQAHSVQKDVPDDVDLLRVNDSQIEDYLTAIKVYHLRYSRSYNARSDSCNLFARLEVGSYDGEGNFVWQRPAPVSASPGWLFNINYTQCTTVRFRGVGMEWRDHEGRKGTEVVRY